MPAPRIAFEEDGPQLPTITAPSGLPFLGKTSGAEKGPGGLGTDEDQDSD